jgi:TonB-linked SusC/RagA family outer membrane protein
MRRFLLFFVLALTGWIGIVAQTVQVRGKISSAEDGSPLPGATVVFKGSTIGTTADMDGIYVINVPSGTGILVFSYVGMKTLEQEIGGMTTIDIAMETASTGLEEVVVTALGIRKAEKNLGYSATSVSSDDITASGSRNAMNALQGKVAGINITSSSGQPGSSSRVLLRGFSSLGGNNQPLYVVDGVPISNRLIGDTDLNDGMDFGNRANDINPEDIETITVLKGASGAALYGSRASNGVIIITTKKGSSRAGKGAKIDFASSTTFESPLRIPEMQNEYGQGWYDGTLEANLEENGSWGPRFDNKTRVWGHIVDNQQQIKPYKALKTNVRDFFESGVTFNNSVSINNGNEKSTYYLSYGNISADGILPGESDSYKRNNFAIRGSSKFGSKLDVSGSFNYIKKDSRIAITGQEQSVMDGIFQTPRDISIVDQKDYNNKFNNVDDYYTIYAQNPYYVLNEHGNNFSENRLFGNVTLDYAWTPWLKTTFRMGSDVSNATLKSWRAITLSKRANYNWERGRVREASYYNSEINTDFIINVNKSFFDKLELNAIIGHNFNQRESRDQSAQVIGLDIPDFYNLSNSSSTPTVMEETSERRLVGAYGSIDLTWGGYLNLNVLARNDWSSTLPESNRSFFYPGVSLSFTFSELLGSGAKSILSFGKIRGGIAKTGNDANPYLINSVFVQGGLTDRYRNLNFPLLNNINGFTLGNRIGNKGLQPEITTEMEIGADLRFFESRFNVDVAVYDKTITDLIWNATLPSSTGFTRQTLNLGKITNKGIELMVSVVPVRTGNFEWKLNWNYTKNNNKLVELVEGLDQIDLGGTGAVGFVGRPGEPLALFEGDGPEFTEDGKIVVTSTGLPVTSTTRKIYGNSQYDYIMGAGTSVSYKGFSMNVLFDIRQGGLMYSRTAEMMYFTGNGPQTTFNDRQPFIIPNSVQRTSSGQYIENTVPVSGFTNNLNQYFNQTYGAGKFGNLFVIDKSFVKLREVSISYRLPKKMLSKTFIQEADLSLIGRNLLLWTPSSNTFIDPEATTFADSNGLEADYGEYGAIPSTRSYGFSVRLSF